MNMPNIQPKDLTETDLRNVGLIATFLNKHKLIRRVDSNVIKKATKTYCSQNKISGKEKKNFLKEVADSWEKFVIMQKNMAK